MGFCVLLLRRELSKVDVFCGFAFGRALKEEEDEKEVSAWELKKVGYVLCRERERERERERGGGGRESSVCR
jgi:hypothetical protein